jgi:hypothetical protein
VGVTDEDAKADAILLQREAMEAGDLLIWTICENPSDFPGLFTCRPHSSRRNQPLQLVLLAKTLEGVRELMPPGLTYLNVSPEDDPVILETWF